MGKRSKSLQLGRRKPSLEVKPTILIYCEGRNTEPSYFNKFKVSSVSIKCIGKGENNLSLVKKAEQLKKKEGYNQVWCVFDADPKPDNPKQKANFNDAIQYAKNKKFNVAYSNQAFEYWIILHFEDHQGGTMNRTDYNHKINNYLNPFNLSYDGEKSKIITQELFDLLESLDYRVKKSRQQLAIERAKRIYEKLDHFNPAENESSTTVFKLVQELIKYS